MLTKHDRSRGTWVCKPKQLIPGVSKSQTSGSNPKCDVQSTDLSQGNKYFLSGQLDTTGEKRDMARSKFLGCEYEKHIPVKYPHIPKWIVIILLLVSLIAFLSVFFLNQPSETRTGILSIVTSPNLTTLLGICALFLATVIVTNVLHELVHGLVYSLGGYDVEWGMADDVDALYAGAFDQTIPRKFDSFAIVAPTIFLNIPALYFLFLGGPLTAFLAATFIAVNLTMALFDFYALSEIWNASSNSVIIHHRPEKFCIYIPKSGD